jgi:hypothetical protein
MFWIVMTMLAVAAVIGVTTALLSPQHAGMAQAVAYATGFAAFALVFGRATFSRYRSNFAQFTNHALIWAAIIVIVGIIGWMIR